MFSLAAFRYRKVLAADGGPVASVESFTLPVRGRSMVQCNARLSVGLMAKPNHCVYGDADGTGTHRDIKVAQAMAVTEALERWAFHSTVDCSRAAEFGFDVDPSSNGMAAFPGIFSRDARRRAMLESVERFSLIAWWEGQARWEEFDTDWPGVSAVAIDGPFGGVTVIAYCRTDQGMYAYGYAAEESFSAAFDRALIELSRHEAVLCSWWIRLISQEEPRLTNRFERRSLFFASEEGHHCFQRRLEDRSQAAMPDASVICDREIVGPWSEYTTVWRFALRPPSSGYLNGGDDYFFW